MRQRSAWDVIIIGAGPAGLSAALILGRCRRRVLVLDAGEPRNAASAGLHGFLTRDGIQPLELLRIALEQLAPYGDVRVQSGKVTRVNRNRLGFRVWQLGARNTFESRKVLFATGVIDRLPLVPGIRQFYGRGVFHCPYCDGWEVRDGPVAVYGKGTKGIELSRTLLAWTQDIVLCTDGPARFPADENKNLAHHGVKVNKKRMKRVEGNSRLERLIFVDGESLPRTALFFSTGQLQRSRLPGKLGCKIKNDGVVATDEDGQTSIAGAYLAGDASKEVQLAIVAAAEGARAGSAINKALTEEDYE